MGAKLMKRNRNIGEKYGLLLLAPVGTIKGLRMLIRDETQLNIDSKWAK